jgi:BirA family transcriptional regulator, biotin operon repressor / biotin---[acetyl-CoA-carboxylase] ligase
VSAAFVQPDTELDALVLGLLIDGLDSPGSHLSGQAIADKLDLTRPQVLERVDSLRARGFALQAVPGAGYRLVGIPDSLSAAVVEPLLAGAELGRPLHLHQELGSTNDEAHRVAEEGAPHGTLVLAESQPQGRGRRGRSWVTAPGKGLALSLVLRPSLPPSRAPELQLVAAVAVCEAARELGAAHAKLKWPNDLECNGRKLAGLLAELRAQGDRLQHVVLGIGLNVNLDERDLPPELRELATSLRLERGDEVPRPWALVKLLERLEHWLSVHESDGFGAVRARWRELSSTLGRRVRVEGAAPLEGEAVDLADDGALVVRDRGGREHRINAGDVEHLRAI